MKKRLASAGLLDYSWLMLLALPGQPAAWGRAAGGVGQGGRADGGFHRAGAVGARWGGTAGDGQHDQDHDGAADLWNSPGLDDPFVVNSQAIMVEGTSMGLTEGAEVTLRTLAAGMLLASGNDAANAAAVRIAGTQADFVMMMNRRAAQLGMSDTCFETLRPGWMGRTTTPPPGIWRYPGPGSPGKRGLPGDLLLGEHEAHVRESALPTGGCPTTTGCWRSTPGCIGLKTGFTKKAGRCLVTAAEREGDHPDLRDAFGPGRLAGPYGASGLGVFAGRTVAPGQAGTDFVAGDRRDGGDGELSPAAARSPAP